MPEFAKILCGALAAFITCLVIGPLTIKILHQFKFGQSIRSDGPQTHLKKAGTPTMGGVMIIIALMVGLAVTGQYSPEVLWLLFITLSFAFIGLLDDVLIIIRKKSLGLKASQKMLAQIVFATIATIFLMSNQLPTSQWIPFTNIKLAFPSLIWGFFNPLFFAFAVFWIVGFSNAVNLTDGLDGLAGGTTAIALLIMGGLTFLQGQYGITVFSFVLAGACLGFVWFNGPPAKVFMGDTGSLALGAAFSGIGLFSQLSLFLPIVGGIFVAEALSVMIQVASYKTTKKRVFKMSPLHHHFELEGMHEPQVMLRFWIVGMVLGVLGVLGYIIRS
jgi:phospho-N-acetylmuramoyl-pentapeptide-transferase